MVFVCIYNKKAAPAFAVFESWACYAAVGKAKQGWAGTSYLSVLRHRLVHSVSPGQNSAGKIVDFLESRLLQEIYRLGAAHARAAVGHNFAAGIEFMHPLGQIAQRNQIAVDVADLIFVGLADIEHK